MLKEERDFCVPSWATLSSMVDGLGLPVRDVCSYHVSGHRGGERHRVDNSLGDT